MDMDQASILNLLRNHDIKFVDLRFTDTLGKEHHLTLPSRQILESNQQWFSQGQTIDGSSIQGWKNIECSDMVLLPDAKTAKIDPFYDAKTLWITCDVIDPITNQGYDRCPRTIAKRAEAYLQSSGIGDTAYFGPEPEFFIFDSITWGQDMSGCHVKIHSDESSWSSSDPMDGNNTGHRPRIKGGYFPVPPVDSLQDLRSSICATLEDLGIPVEIHHHEVAHAGQCEVGTKFSTLVERADWTQTLKYVVHNVAHHYGKTATFMPKPIPGDNGSGMHVHQSIWKNGQNLFAGQGYAGLSDLALYYIGGVIKHARALNAITNSTINSYKRLVPGFEAPVMLAYSAHNRSASIRIPFAHHDKARRVEFRFPDPVSNPYLVFSALMMAGLDGIINRIHPGEAADYNLYELSQEQSKRIPRVCVSLEEALEELDKDRSFLTAGNVFSNDWIDSYLNIKLEDIQLLRSVPHPLEFDLYYGL
jgi:glutamine synthetase